MFEIFLKNKLMFEMFMEATQMFLICFWKLNQCLKCLWMVNQCQTEQPAWFAGVLLQSRKSPDVWSKNLIDCKRLIESADSQHQPEWGWWNIWAGGTFGLVEHLGWCNIWVGGIFGHPSSLRKKNFSSLQARLLKWMWTFRPSEPFSGHP